MGLNAFLSGDDNTKIAQSDVIYITDKIVKFGDDVYQFRNVTGFGIGEIKAKKPPFLLVGFFIFLLIIGLYISSKFNNLWGLLIAGISSIVLFVQADNYQPKKYGLKLYLNSGDAQIFITSDTVWLKRSVRSLYDFMENAEEGSSMTIHIGGNITGNIIQGSKVRDVFSDVNKSL